MEDRKTSLKDPPPTIIWIHALTFHCIASSIFCSILFRTFIFFYNFLWIVSSIHKTRDKYNELPYTYHPLSPTIQILPFLLLEYFLVNYRHSIIQSSMQEYASLKHKDIFLFEHRIIITPNKTNPSFYSLGQVSLKSAS